MIHTESPPRLPGVMEENREKSRIVRFGSNRDVMNASKFFDNYSCPFKYFDNYINIIHTVHLPISNTPIYPQNPIYPHFFGHENVTNWVRGGIQKTKCVNL